MKSRWLPLDFHGADRPTEQPRALGGRTRLRRGGPLAGGSYAVATSLGPTPVALPRLQLAAPTLDQ